MVQYWILVFLTRLWHDEEGRCFVASACHICSLIQRGFLIKRHFYRLTDQISLNIDSRDSGHQESMACNLPIHQLWVGMDNVDMVLLLYWRNLWCQQSICDWSRGNCVGWQPAVLGVIDVCGHHSMGNWWGGWRMGSSRMESTKCKQRFKTEQFSSLMVDTVCHPADIWVGFSPFVQFVKVLFMSLWPGSLSYK